jgi:hypothetical protein
MLKASVYQSDKLDAREAVREVVQGLKAQDPDVARSKVVFAYSSCAYNTPSMLDEFSAQLPDVPVIGNTSFTGVITPKGFVGGDGFLGAMALDDPDMAVGVAAEPKTDAGQDAVELGEKVAKLAMKAAGKDCAPAYYYMAASPAEEEYYVKGITHVIGRVPFFGGSAADNAIAGDWKLYTSSGDFADGVAVAFFYTDKPMTNVYTGAYHETGDVGVVTKVIGNRTLAEIDGVPALEKYAEWRGMDIDSLRGSALLSASVVSPLGVKDRLGDLVAIRHPMAGNDDNTIGLGNKVAKNTAVIRMEATVDELIDSTGKTLGELGDKAGDPGTYLLVHCGGRRAGIGDRIGEVADQLKSAANGVPFLCEFTFGEYGQVDDGANTCGGLMLSFTALGK